MKRNTKILISIDAANKSELIWVEDAAEWKPERWLLPSIAMNGSEGTELDHSGHKAHNVAKVQLPGVYSGTYVFDSTLRRNFAN